MKTTIRTADRKFSVANVFGGGYGAARNAEQWRRRHECAVVAGPSWSRVESDHTEYCHHCGECNPFTGGGAQ